MAPSSVALLTRYRSVTIVCIPCAVLMPPPEGGLAPLTPLQVREILDALREERPP